MLTGLGNRRALEQFTVDLAAQRNPHQTMPLSVLLIDVDHFKRVNDTHGHSQGDEVLRQLGRSLRDCARQRDSVVRYGGEEFAMLLPHTDTQQAMQMAQRLHDRIRTLRPAGLDITVSIGIASGSLTTAEDVSRLISQADKALYEAKNEGRNRTRVSGVA
jgi:two-component system cell cycle response regulator